MRAQTPMVWYQVRSRTLPCLCARARVHTCARICGKYSPMHEHFPTRPSSCCNCLFLLVHDRPQYVTSAHRRLLQETLLESKRPVSRCLPSSNRRRSRFACARREYKTRLRLYQTRTRAQLSRAASTKRKKSVRLASCLCLSPRPRKTDRARLRTRQCWVPVFASADATNG